MRTKFRKISASIMAFFFAFSVYKPPEIKAEKLINQTPANPIQNTAQKTYENTYYDTEGNPIVEYSLKPVFLFNGESASILDISSVLTIYDYDKVLEAITSKNHGPQNLATVTYRFCYQFSETEKRFISVTISCDKNGNILENWSSE